MNTILSVISAVVGGVIIGFFVGKKNKRSIVEKIKKYDALSLDNERLQKEKDNIDKELKNALIKVGRCEELDTDKKRLEAKIQEQSEKVVCKQTTISNLEKEKVIVEEQKKNNEKELAFIKEEKEKILIDSKSVFENIANKIIKEHSETFKKDNKDELNNILDPLKTNIDDFREKIEKFHEKQNENHIHLEYELTRTRKMNDSLAKEAKDLTTALLQNKKVQGNWGEMILERVLECSGLEKGIQYEKQLTCTTETGKYQRPDFVIKLPNGRKVIIDCKMSIVNYQKWCVESDEINKDDFLKQHVKDIKTHIDNLSDKEYQKLYKENGPDFVIMFIPIEYAYFVALEKDKNLNEYALKKEIIIATHFSIFPILKLVEGMWIQENQRKNVLEIAKVGGVLYDKFVTFTEALLEVNRKITEAKDKTEEVVKRLSTSEKKAIVLWRELRS